MIGIIGGSGLDKMPGLEVRDQITCQTPFGGPSTALTFGEREGQSFLFLPRHGADHDIPPHRINYRANIWALKEQGVNAVIGIAAVGGISSGMAPGTIAVPDQIIDYTHGRDQTFHDGDFLPLEHMEFGEPYCETLRQSLLQAAGKAGLQISDDGCYGAVQGPRLETAAEIHRMANDGVDLVGMTGMPEAALAREAGLCYAVCAVVANWAAGISQSPVSMAGIERQLRASMDDVLKILANLEKT